MQYHAYLFAAALALNVVLNSVFVPRFGYMAAAWTTLASYVALAAGFVVASSSFYAFPMDRRRLGLVLASGIAALVAGAELSNSGWAEPLVARAGVLAALLAFWYVGVLTAAERSRLHPRQLLRAS